MQCLNIVRYLSCAANTLGEAKYAGSCRCCWKLIVVVAWSDRVSKGASGGPSNTYYSGLPLATKAIDSTFGSWEFHPGASIRFHTSRDSTTCSTGQSKRSFTTPQSPKSWPLNGFQRSIGEQKSSRLSFWNEFLVPDSTLVKWNVDFCTDKIFFLAAFDFLSNCCFTSFVESS